MYNPLVPFCLLALACSPAAGAADLPPSSAVDGFWDHWGDGNAELGGYSLTQNRYGELRRGTAVLVFVTETFTHGARVKSDGGHDDEYPVFKLNEVRDYHTGIYDYNVMTSTFVPLDGRSMLGQPVKVSMGMQEWCGHVYEQLVPTEAGVDWTSHSYFDGEADRQVPLESPADGIYADSLPIIVRGLTGTLLEPGAKVTVPVLPTLVHGRYAHRAPTWTTGTLTRSTGTQSVEVPAGSFDVYTVEADITGVPATTWYVEAASPHRLVKWTRVDGEQAELLGSARKPYWQLNGPGAESHLAELGLRAPR